MADETLEWELGIDADTSGGARLDAQLGRLESQFEQVNRQLIRMEQGSKRASGAHEEHERHTKGLTGAFQRLIEQGLDPFLHKAKEIAEFEFIREGTEKLLELPFELAKGVAELGEEMIRTAARSERFEMAFRNAVGAKDSEATLGYIEKIGKHTEFTQDQLKGMNLELAKSGYKGGDLARATEAMIDLASMSANPQEGASRAMAALQRVRTTGKLESRALVPFGISEQSLLNEIGKETGMSAHTGTSSTGGKVASQVQKAMEAGRVPIETELNSLYTLITQKTGKALGGAGADMEQSIEAKLTHLHELPELYFERLSHSRGYDRVSEQISKLLDGLDPDSPRGKRIFAALETAFDHIADVMSSFDLAGTIEKGIDVLDLFATEFIDMLSVIPGETGAKAGKLAAQMKARREEKAVNEAKAQAEEENAAATSKIMAKQFVDYPAAERVQAVNKGLYRPADDETPFLYKGIDKSTGDFEEAGRKAGKALEKGTRDATKTHSPSEVFADIGSDAADGFAQGFDGDQVQDQIDKLGVAGGMGGGRGAGGPTIVLNISPQIYINGEGVDAQAIAQEAAQRIAEIVPSAVQSALEQLALQGGPAS